MKIILILTSVLFLSSCGAKSSYNQKQNLKSAKNPADLERLHSLSSTSAKAKSNTIRLNSLRDTALSVGARGGLAWRARQINTILTGQEPALYRIFNFHGLMLDNNVLPPVLSSGKNTLQLAGQNTVRLADQSYKIISQAQFVTAPPTWRKYLWLHYNEPEEPNGSLLPKNKAERDIWKKYIVVGWHSGIGQADIIFAENLGRLKRDYEGMIRYHSLLAQHIVSKPFVAKANFGITGNGNSITINDQLLRITDLPTLQVDSREWQTEISLHE